MGGFSPEPGHFLAAGTDHRAARPAVLPYSPGYCGWDLSGQRQLFAQLQPDAIGISLNDSCLMQPMKSVSGVFVAGEGEIHEFVNEYDFCSLCTTMACRRRLKSLTAA